MSRSVPVPDERSAPYWAAAGEHRLVLSRCQACARLSHPPEVVCPHCHAPDAAFAWEPVDGGGTVRSWIVVRQSFLPGFDDDVPFVLADVALDADPDVRLIGRLLDGPGAPLAIGDRVRVAFEDLGPGTAVPAFALEESG